MIDIEQRTLRAFEQHGRAILDRAMHAQTHIIGDAEQFALVSGDLDEPAMDQFIVAHAGRDFAYLQCYDLTARNSGFGTHPKGTRGIDQFKKNPKFQVMASGSRAKTILAINHARKPLNDVRVRRAIAQGFNYDAFIQGTLRGKAKRATSLVPDSSNRTMSLPWPAALK